MKIGLIGTSLVGNTNLGCVALTYSLVKLLNDIDSNNQIVVFDWRSSEQVVKEMCEELKINSDNIESSRLSKVNSKHIFKKLSFFSKLKKCDVIICLTEGDSFTDIYGNDRFYTWSKILDHCGSKKIPVIFGPQTYGPFNDPKNKKHVERLLGNSYEIITRDKKSQKFIYELIGRKAKLTTDLAFSLPYVDATEKNAEDKTRVGINISGLLWFEKGEMTKKGFELGVDYRRLIYQIIEKILENEQHEIYLIPHVMFSDERSHNEIIMKYPEIKEAPHFKSPIEAKSFISTMDVFLGSRMHATIASYSSGVPTIPLSYSRKFEGLFGSLGYEHSLSLINMSEDEITSKVMEKIDFKEKLRNEIETAKPILKEKEELLKSIIKSALNDIENREGTI